MKILAAGCLACAGLLMLTEEMVAQRSRFLVDAAQFECVVEHKTDYLAAAKDPMMLFLSLCPKVTPTTAEKSRLAQNLGPNPAVGPDEEVTKFLSLRYRELECILQPGNSAVKLLPKEERQQRVYVIELANCH